MILRGITIRHWRGIEHAQFDALSDSLNLFYGPNESGKSTIVEALRYAFFEGSKGAARHKLALKTWGGTGTPEIEVHFVDDAGEDWWIRKRFVDHPMTELDSRNVQYKGDEAESRLHAMLGTRSSGNRKPQQDEDLGIWPLLWVQQGRSALSTRDTITPDARHEINDTLAEQTGIIASGPVGQAILNRARTESATYWTEKGGRRKSFHAILEARDAAAQALRETEERAKAARQAVASLQRARRTQTELKARIHKQKQQVDTAESRANAAREIRGQRDAAARELELKDLQRANTEAEQSRRGALVQELETLAAAAPALDTTREASQARVDALREKKSDAGRRLQEAEAVQTKARRTARLAHQAETQKAQQQRFDALEAQLEQAESMRREREELQTRVAGNPIDRMAMRALQDDWEQLVKLRSQLDAESVSLSIVAKQPLSVDGNALEEGRAHDITIRGETRVVLDGIASLRISPGAGELDALRKHSHDAEATFARRLSELGVDSISRARLRHESRQQDEHRIQAISEQIQSVAPDGIAALRARRNAARAMLDQIDAIPSDLPTTQEATAAVESAEEAVRALRHEVDVLDGPREEATRALAEARSAVERNRADRARIETQLGDMPSADDLAAAVAAAGEAVLGAHEALREVDASYQAVGGDDAEPHSDKERAALAKLRERQADVDRECIQLDTAIRQRAEEGLHDRLLEAQTEADTAAREADVAERKAAARAALLTALTDAYQDMKDRFAEPIRQAVSDGVRLLFPQSELVIDDEGDVIGLRTGSIVEPFDELSGGAREQFGVLIRLGLARILSGDRRLPVILDDALVNSDIERRNRMVEVMRRAADDLQVLVFTCHDEDFDRLCAEQTYEVTARAARSA